MGKSGQMSINLNVVAFGRVWGNGDSGICFLPYGA